MLRDRFWCWFYGIFENIFGDLYDYFLTKRMYVGSRCRRCAQLDGMHRSDCDAR